MLLPILVFTHGCAYSVPYAAVLYAEFAYIVTYDFLELNIVVLLCLIRRGRYFAEKAQKYPDS